MLNDIATAADLRSLDIATLREWHRDASDSAAVCLPGTETHAHRVAWLSDIAAELTRRGH